MEDRISIRACFLLPLPQVEAVISARHLTLFGQERQRQRKAFFIKAARFLGQFYGGSARAPCFGPSPLPWGFSKQPLALMYVQSIPCPFRAAPSAALDNSRKLSPCRGEQHRERGRYERLKKNFKTRNCIQADRTAK